MKIVFLIPSLGIGGAEKVVINLANGFSRIGHEVTILTINNRELELIPLLSKDVNVHILGNRGSWKTRKKLLNYLIINKPDLLISNLPNCNIISGWAVRKIKKRIPMTLICTEHGIFSELIKKNSILVQFLTRIFVNKYYQYADWVIAVSESIKNDLIKWFPKITGKIVVIHNPIDISTIKSLSKENVNHPFFSTEEKIISSVGRLSREKGFPFLIRAFSKVINEVPCKLLIIGSGDEKEILKRLISELNLKDHVDILESDSNPYKYISKSNLFVSSSISEGFGLTILEALVCGVPIVATNAGGIASDILKKTKRGVLVTPGDTEALKKGILQGMELEQNEPNFDLSEFSVETIIIKYQELILKNIK